ncbi:MAG: hypothetical protein H6849_03985 [Alphaproteobacteria bacterium]|nr:MAG: hypothetical protein H6849_03985 [Alphaproteobacteria bacterium]
MKKWHLVFPIIFLIVGLMPAHASQMENSGLSYREFSDRIAVLRSTLDSADSALETLADLRARVSRFHSDISRARDVLGVVDVFFGHITAREFLRECDPDERAVRIAELHTTFDHVHEGLRIADTLAQGIASFDDGFSYAKKALDTIHDAVTGIARDAEYLAVCNFLLEKDEAIFAGIRADLDDVRVEVENLRKMTQYLASVQRITAVNNCLYEAYDALGRGDAWVVRLHAFNRSLDNASAEGPPADMGTISAACEAADGALRVVHIFCENIEALNDMLATWTRRDSSSKPK